jgi:D-lactate dehydrogenase (cytochrome)
MPSHRVRTRPPRESSTPPLVATEPETIGAYLEDAAHYPGGHAAGVACPRTEGEVAALVRTSRRILPIGAQSSVTGGATPMGEVIVSTARMNSVVEIRGDRVRVQPGVAISALQESLAAAGCYYPPFPTYTAAFAGGVVATNASGAATFKYGSTRGWVEALTVVLASGEALDLERGQVRAHPDRYFEIEHTATGGSKDPPYDESQPPYGKARVTLVPVPTYRMPDVPKRSAGYFAEPGMDLIDLFIGAEGTLGIITEVTFRVLTRIPALALALVPVPSEAKAVALVDALRRASQRTWRERDPRGLDVAAIENMDRRCLLMLREDGVDRKHDVTFPDDTAIALVVQLELAPETTSERAYDEIGNALAPSAPDTPLVRFCRLLDEFGLLDATELALPGDQKRRQQLLDVREAVPSAVNQRVGEAKRATGQDIEKTAADMIVPFEHFGEMLEVYHEGYRRRGLDHAIWGHISDGNVHPNVIPRTIDDVRAGKEAILEFGREVARRGGCPLAEHGVGRSPVKQALLKQLYGDRGIQQMRAVKRALDPQRKLAPGVLFGANEE